MSFVGKRIILIFVGSVICGIGLYISNQAVGSVPQGLSYMETQNRLALTNYPFGIGIFAVGLVMIVLGIFWKRISAKYKP